MNIWRSQAAEVSWRRRALVLRPEYEVRTRGGLTLCLSTDVVANLTSFGGVDLYPGVIDKPVRLENLRRHSPGFYLRLGFEIAGVVPDAIGFGRPDIMIAKRVAAELLHAPVEA
jgi:aminoglycoside 6'-N-acetyltransferase I